RKQDIPKLCEYFINKMARDTNTRLADSELNKLIEYEWPGNVRELKNVIERALIIQHGRSLKPSQMLKNGYNLSPSVINNYENIETEVPTLETIKKKCIEQALAKYKGNYSQTARA